MPRSRSQAAAILRLPSRGIQTCAQGQQEGQAFQGQEQEQDLPGGETGTDEIPSAAVGFPVHAEDDQGGGLPLGVDAFDDLFRDFRMDPAGSIVRGQGVHLGAGCHVTLVADEGVAAALGMDSQVKAVDRQGENKDGQQRQQDDC